MSEPQSPRRNPLVEALLGFLAALGVLPFEFVAMVAVGSFLGGSAITVFWVFLLVGLAYFGLCFWLAVANRRFAMLPGLIVGFALWGLLSTACYQLVTM